MPFVRLLGRLTPSFVPTARNPYGLFRSWRWRKAVRTSAYEGYPTHWDICCTSDRACEYVCEIRRADEVVPDLEPAHALIRAEALALALDEDVGVGEAAAGWMSAQRNSPEWDWRRTESRASA